MPRRSPTFLQQLGALTGATAAREAEERARRRADPRRLHLDAFYRSSLWTRTRNDIVRAEPLCRTCRAEGRTEVATVVDHVIPISVAWARRLDPTNLQPLCRVCHDRKTAEDARRYGTPGPVPAARPSPEDDAPSANQ